jgi:hypothetical protein
VLLQQSRYLTAAQIRQRLLKEGFGRGLIGFTVINQAIQSVVLRARIANQPS